MAEYFQHDWRDERTHATASAAVAKAGIALKGAKPGNASASDLLHDRNELRKLVNTLRDTAHAAHARHDSKAAEAAVDEMAAVSTWVRRTQDGLDILDQTPTAARAAADGAWRDSGGRPLKAMRTRADFEAHYRADERGNADGETTLGAFFRGVAGMPTTPAIRNALSEGTNSAGGFAVPSILMPDILSALAPNSSLLQAGMPIVPLADGAKTYTTAVMSGIPTAAWRSEAGAVSESDPVFSSVVAAPQSLAFFFRISRELLADAPNLEQALLTSIGQAMAKEMDRAGLRGTGTAPQPRGISNTSGIQSVSNGANGAALAGYTNFMSAIQALLTADAPMPTAAIMHPRSLVKLGGLIDTTNQPLRRPPILDGLPLLTTSQIPVNLTVGTSTDCSEIYLGDFSKMALMLRESLSVQLLSELYAANGQVGFMCHVRADFAVMYPAAFAVVTGIRA